MERRGRYPAEVRERGVRLVFEEQESHKSRPGRRGEDGTSKNVPMLMGSVSEGGHLVPSA